MATALAEAQDGVRGRRRAAEGVDRHVRPAIRDLADPIGNVVDLTINGTSLPEAGINALIAGSFDVPVIFLAGDLAIVDQAKELFGDIETVSTKDGIGRAELGKHPVVAQQEIYEGVARALQRLGDFQPYKFQAPYTMDLRVRRDPEEMYPGSEKVADGHYTFTHDDILEVVRAFDVLH